MRPLAVENTNRKNLLHKEPGVINQKLIRTCLRALLPKGEEGLYAREQGVDERRATHLLIEFQSIARIANISHMVSLKKLQLCNNIIEEIAGLDSLVNLTYLDLAYNCIKKIQNLDKLIKLDTLILHRNFITTIENMDNQLRLQIFVISANALNNSENLKYLRQFVRLSVLVIEGNPMCEEPNFRSFTLAHLPELIILDYQRIKSIEQSAAAEKYQEELEQLKAIEATARRASVVEAALEEKEIYKKAFVSAFQDDEFWNALYQDDNQGQIILHINEIEEIRATYHELFRRASKDLFQKGMKAYNLREEEYKAFNAAVKEAKDVVKLKGQHLTEEFVDTSRGQIREMRNIVLILDDIERNRVVTSNDHVLTPAAAAQNKIHVKEKARNEERLQILVTEFIKKLHNLWYTMMTEEVDLNEQITEVGQELGRGIYDLTNNWKEQVRGHFAQLRDVQIQYHDRLIETLVTYGEFRRSDTSIPEHLKDLLTDKEALGVVVQASHEHHSSVIDQMEESMVANLNKWQEVAGNNIRIEEVARSRKRICEISHFVDTHVAILHKLKIISHLPGTVPDVRDDQNKINEKSLEQIPVKSERKISDKADEDEEEEEEEEEEDEGEGEKPTKVKKKKKGKKGKGKNKKKAKSTTDSSRSRSKSPKTAKPKAKKPTTPKKAPKAKSKPTKAKPTKQPKAKKPKSKTKKSKSK